MECFACQEHITHGYDTRPLNGKLYCEECFEELAHGKIPKVTDMTNKSPGAGGVSPLEDSSPWADKVLREWEGD